MSGSSSGLKIPYSQVIYSRYYWYVQHRTDTKVYYQLYYVVVPCNNFIAHVGRSVACRALRPIDASRIQPCDSRCRS
eukprot:SAG11_NODE_2649_length_3126_cov_9.746614_3_plen_77_part_00